MDPFNELSYQFAVAMARQMLADGLIKPDEFEKFDAYLREKYQPVLAAMTKNLT